MKPSVLFVLRSAWNDTLVSLSRLRHLALVVLLICLAGQLARAFLPSDGRLGGTLDTLLDAVSIFAVVPYQIAIYRLVILGEVTTSYSFTANTDRVRRFLAWSAVPWIGAATARLILGLLPASLAVALIIAVAVVGIRILLRLSLLFPAIAVDGAGASVINAFADSNGRLWFIARSLLVAFIPMAFALVAIIALGFSYIGNTSNPDTSRTLIGAILLSALGTISITSNAVVVARLYEWIGERVKGMVVR